MGRWHDYAKSGMVMLKSYTWSCRRLEVWHMVRATMHDRAKSYFLPFFRASSRIVAQFACAKGHDCANGGTTRGI